MPESKPTVSVIIPTYNRGSLLSRSVRSVLYQTYTDFELIVVNDGSSDNTDQIMKIFQDSRIVYIKHSTNKGASAARNTGLKIAKGSFIAFQDSDDEWLPEKLEKQVQILENSPIDVGVVYCDLNRYNLKGEKRYFSSPNIMPEDGIIFEEALDDRVHNIGTQTLLVRRECFEKVGYFDEKLLRYIDWEMLIRLSRYYRFHHMKEPLVNYYVTKGNLTSKGVHTGIPAVRIIYEKYYDDIKKNRKLLAKRFYWLGSYMLQTGQERDGRIFLWRAFATRPFNLRYFFALIISLLGSAHYGRLHKFIKR